MKHPERVEDYLEHTAQAIERATGYVQRFDSVEALQKDQQVQDAVIRNFRFSSQQPDTIQLRIIKGT
jgi:uncharacterized protein with HEPN domain